MLQTRQFGMVHQAVDQSPRKVRAEGPAINTDLDASDGKALV